MSEDSEFLRQVFDDVSDAEENANVNINDLIANSNDVDVAVNNLIANLNNANAPNVNIPPINAPNVPNVPNVNVPQNYVSIPNSDINNISADSDKKSEKRVAPILSGVKKPEEETISFCLLSSDEEEDKKDEEYEQLEKVKERVLLREIKRLEEEVEKKKQKLLNKKRKIEKLEEENEDLADENTYLEDENDRLEKENDQLRETNAALRNDNEKLREEHVCGICYTNKCNRILYDCFHAFCGSCIANEVRCPKCKRNIIEIRNIYF